MSEQQWSSHLRHIVVEHATLWFDLTRISQLQLQCRAQLALSVLVARPEPLSLNAIGFKNVSVEGAARFHYDGHYLSVWILDPSPGQHVSITVHYELDRPAAGLAFMEDGSVATDLEALKGRYVWPLVDSPDARVPVDLHLRSHKSLTRLGSGKLISEIENKDDNTVTSIWRQERPIPPYLIAFACGPFSKFDEWVGPNRVPAAVYGPSRLSQAVMDNTFGMSKDILQWMTEEFGLFPSAKFYQLQINISTALENESLIGIPDSFLMRDSRDMAEEGWNTTRVLVHEAAHAYFGNAVTLASFSHLWIKEGFATIIPHLYFKARVPEQSDMIFIYDYCRYVYGGGGRHPTCRRVYRHEEELYSADSYTGAALRFYAMARYMGGQDVFWKGAKAFLRRYGGKEPVEAVDFRRVMEQTSGVSLKAWFDQWIYRAGHPILSIQVQGGQLKVEQVQSGLPYEFDLPVRLGNELIVLTFDKKQRCFVVDIGPKENDEVVFILDPENTRGILFEISLSKSSIPQKWIQATLSSVAATILTKFWWFSLLKSPKDQISTFEAEPRSAVRTSFLMSHSIAPELVSHVIQTSSDPLFRYFAVKRCKPSTHRDLLIQNLDSFGHHGRSFALRIIGAAKNPVDVALFKAEQLAREAAFSALGQANEVEYLMEQARQVMSDPLARFLPPGLAGGLSRCQRSETLSRGLRDIIAWSVERTGRIPMPLAISAVQNGLPDLIKEEFFEESDWLLEIMPLLSELSKKDSASSSARRPLDGFSIAFGVVLGAMAVFAMQVARRDH